MDRGNAYRHLEWLLLPVSLVLALSALSLPRQPYTGVVMRGDWVAAVEPGSPGAKAGLARADRVLLPEDAGALHHPLARAMPGQPLALLRERGDRLDAITLLPATLPFEERRLMAALLAVASGFVVLGGWVWSERRDALTRAFFLLCLAFAVMLVPFPRGLGAGATAAWESFYGGVTLLVPALFVHFFALFPEPVRRGRRRGVVRIGYAVAASLFGASLLLLGARAWLGRGVEPALALLQAMAGAWFALGVLVSLALFARAVGSTRGDDARRRLRVALIGCVLGVTPLTALIAMHSLLPGVPRHAERWAVLLVLLVPASFAWAIAVHRVFAFRVALRALVTIGLLGTAGALVYGAGEVLGAAWRPDLGDGFAGGALAFIAMLAAAAGPANAWLRGAGERFLPERERAPLEAWLAEREDAPRLGRDALLASACDAVVEALRLDGAVAVDARGGDAHVVAARGALVPPALSDGFMGALAFRGPRAVRDLEAPERDREALDAAGAGWVLPAGAPDERAALLLGRRLAGAWLGVREARELARFAEHLGLMLENASLREAAHAHAGLDRSLTRAGAIQARLSPRRLPASRALDAAAAALSCEAVGGDTWDCVEGPNRTVTLAVGDAAGKGVPAALLSVWAQASFRNRAHGGGSPGRVLAGLNAELAAMGQPDAFVALLCAQVDPVHGAVTFANAGLTPPLLRRRDGRWSELTQGGVLLGVTAAAEYPDVTVELEAGDLLVLYTDGLSEARCGDELFGSVRLAQTLDLHAHRSAAEIVRALLGAVRAFADHPLDDLTVVVLRQRRRPRRRGRPEIGLKPAELLADTAR